MYELWNSSDLPLSESNKFRKLVWLAQRQKLDYHLRPSHTQNSHMMKYINAPLRTTVPRIIKNLSNILRSIVKPPIFYKTRRPLPTTEVQFWGHITDYLQPPDCVPTKPLLPLMLENSVFDAASGVFVYYKGVFIRQLYCSQSVHDNGWHPSTCLPAFMSFSCR